MKESDEVDLSSMPAQTAEVARDAMQVLKAADLPFLVAGAYALAVYTGIERHTKDFDVLVRESDIERCLEVLSAEGFRTELASDIWLAKAHRDDEFVDLIFNSGNAVSPVDDSWFEHAPERELLGMPMSICPVEEIIWTKAFIMERERFDGADVAHLLRCCADEMDWEHLLERFGEHWRVLLSHLVLFGFIYPSARDKIPKEVMRELVQRVGEENEQPAPDVDICRGTLLSRTQYLVDVDRWGCYDGRIQPHGELTRDQADELSPRG